MGIFGWSFAKKKPEKKENPYDAALATGTAIEGRSSQTLMQEIASFTGSKVLVMPPDETVLRFLETATLMNPGLSNSSSVITSLAHQKYTIRPIEQNAIAEERLLWFEENCYPGGLTTLSLSLFDQYMHFGADSAEMEIDLELMTMKRIWLVPVVTVRFIATTDGEILPAQIQANKMEPKLLSPLTYRYICGLPWKDGYPYGRPPFLAAIDSVVREGHFFENYDNMIEKMGLFGIVDTEYKKLEKFQNEEPQAYNLRVQKFQEALKLAEESRTKVSTRIHSDSIKNTISQVVTNINGAKDAHLINQEQLASGTGVPESMLGRPRATTEAFANVMYMTVTNQAETAQRIVAHMLSYFASLFLALEGIPVAAEVVFDKPASLNPLIDEQAESVRLANIALMEDRGWITPEIATQMAVEVTLSAENRRPFELRLTNDKASTDAIYLSVETPSGIVASYDELSPKVRQIFLAFLVKLRTLQKKAVDATIDKTTKALIAGHVDRVMNPEDYSKIILDQVDDNWKIESIPVSGLMQKTIPELYEAMVLTGMKPEKNMPKFTMTATAEKVRAFEAKFNGHLATTMWASETKGNHQALATWLSEQMIENPDIFQRTRKESIAAFREAFGSQMRTLTDTQIRMIRDTFFMRLRNGSRLEQYSQMGYETVTINRVPGACPICQTYEGRSFSVQTQYEQTSRQYDLSHEAFIDHLRSSGKVLASGQNGSVEADAAWESAKVGGFAMPPYHPMCRHSIIREKSS